MEVGLLELAQEANNRGFRLGNCRAFRLARNGHPARRIAHKMVDMKHEYHEGPKAGENFKKLATAVFKTRKIANPKRQPKPKPTSGKNEG